MSYLSDLLGSAYKEGMTEEEISTALEASKSSESSELMKLKNALSKANSEAADYKKQLRSKQTDDEAAEAARKEEHEKLLKEIEELRRDKTVSGHKTKLLSLGYDEKLADETAKAMADGDMAKVMENQSKFLDFQKKAITADLMRKAPRPASGADEGSNTLDLEKKFQEAQASGDYAAMAYYTRLRASEEAKEAN